MPETHLADQAEGLPWLDGVEQLVLQVHRDFGDATVPISRARQHDLAIELRDDAGALVTSTASRLDPAYSRRS